MNNWTSESRLVRGLNLHYYRTGMGKNLPPLVLAHGITDDGLCWTPVAEVLASQYDVYMVDARGHGKSDAPEDGYSTDSLAADLGELIRGLGLSKPIILGHSMGAITALAMAALYPDLPKAVILEDPPAFWVVHPESDHDEAFRLGFYTWISGLKRKTYDDLLEEVRANSPTWSEAEIKPWVDSKHRVSINVANFMRQPNIPALDLLSLLKAVTCPVYLISADHDLGAIITDADIASLKQSIPALHAVHIPGAGHSIHREQFDKYMSALQQILQACG